MAALVLVSNGLSANPTGGRITAGSATIAGQGTGAVTINQTSKTTIIDWQTFSINSGESTSFLQPGASSAALNRVLGGQTSLINGALSGNGRVYLINGNGIIVGPGGVVKANAFTASTRDISDADFLSGQLHFTGSGEAGVANLGSITALGGNVALIGRTVDNEGTITAPHGTAGLVAGDDVLLAQGNADGSTITVSPVTMAAGALASASGRVGVKNGGAISAAAAELKAANGNIYGLAVQNLGTVRATTVSHQGGHIWLTSDTGTVMNVGTLDASAMAARGRGGDITLKSIAGTVNHSGAIVSHGGRNGAGGKVDISGAEVKFTGTVDLTAPGGTRGSLLLDPTDIDVVTGGGSDLSASTIDPSAIVAALDGANVTLNGTNSITVDSMIDSSANTGAGNLILDTPNLNLNAPIVLNGTLSGTASLVSVAPTGLLQNGVDAAGLGGTVSLSSAVYGLSGEIVIRQDVVLQGNGAILSGMDTTRIMEIDSGTVTLSGLTFMGGNGNSVAGAAMSNFNGDGGAILVFGQGTSATVSIDDCTFVGNNGSGGGAIFNVSISSGSDTLLVNNSTFTGNTASLGTAIYNYASFGGNATVSLTNDTIALNSGTAAIYNTILSSGSATVEIGSSILAGNMQGGTESDYVDGGGGTTFTDMGYNLYGQNGDGGGFVSGGSNGTTDILLAGPIQTVLVPLGNYGGTTPTLALVAGSPALDAGDPMYIESSDQRGIGRGESTAFTGSGADIGAFEAQFVGVQADPVTVVYGDMPVLTYSITNGPAAAIGSIFGTPELINPATDAGFYAGDIGQGTVMSTPQYILTFTNGDLTINPRLVVVDPDPGQSKIFGTPDPVLTYTTEAGGLVNGDTLTGSPSYDGAGEQINVGSYTTNTGSLANNNYMVQLGSTPPSFAITQRTVVVDPDPGQGKTYGTPDPTLTFSTEPTDATTGLVGQDQLTGSPGYASAGPFTAVGFYATNLGTVADSTGNYNTLLTATPPPFVIAPRTVFINPDAGQGKVYGSLDPLLTYTTGTATATTGLVNGDALSGSPSYDGAGPFTSVGAYPTNPGTLFNVNYTVQVVATAPTFAISPRPVVVDPDPGQSKIYGAPDPILTYTTDPADTTMGLVNGDTLTGSPGYLSRGQGNVGTYATTLGSLANSNYSISLSSSAPTFAITQRSVVVDPDPGQSKVYGTPDPTLTFTTDPATATSGLIPGDTLSGSPSINGTGTFANVGTYATNLGTVADSTGNYIVSLSAVAPSFSITKRPVLIDADAGQAKIYGTPDPMLTYTIETATATTGLLNGDTVTGSPSYVGASTFANVGVYPTNFGTVTGTGNYTVAVGPTSATFVINQRPVVVDPDPGQSKIYGTPDPTLTYTTDRATATTGLVNGDTLSGSPSYNGAGQVVNVGAYGTIRGSLSNPNYMITVSAAAPTFLITAAALSYAATPVTVLNGAVLPAFMGTVTGFAFGDTLANVTTGTLTFSTTADSSTAGGFPILGSGLTLTSPNYTLQQAPGNYLALTVLPPIPPPSVPNTTISQAIAQTTASTTTVLIGSQTSGNGPGLTPAAAPIPDINVTSISPGESIDSTTSTGAQASSDAGTGTGAVGQGSSFDPNIGATAVTPGEAVTVGGRAGVPLPVAVQTQLVSILNTQTLGSLSDALAGVPEADDMAATTAVAAGGTAGSTGQGQSSIPAGSAAAASAAAGSAPVATSANGAPLGPPTVVAPGQTVSLGGGRAVSIPVPANVQTQINQGFTTESRATMAQAAGL